MKYCKKCVQPDTRPKIEVDENGVCYACKFAEEREHVDWQKREEELREIAEWAKKNSQGKHNCIIGVSGGKDSTFQALYARDKLGLNCLLVNLAPDPITEWGAHNIENLIQQGFDTMLFRPNPKVWKKTIKHAFYKYGNPVKPTEYPLWSASYITAIKFGIPLIIQGENPGTVLGVTEGLGIDGNALNINMGNTLNGGDASEWEVDGIKTEDLIWYQYPKKEDFEKADIKAIYLQHYACEWSFSGNTEFAAEKGITKRGDHDPVECGRVNPYCSIDSDAQIVNQMLKYYKLGFGFTTDEACYYIREGKMTREEGIELVKKYDGKCGEKYLKDFCDYIDISVEEFWRVTDSYVNKDLFEKDAATGKWIPKFEAGVDFEQKVQSGSTV
jgi:N-acetyl sugar amidotransferase